jgi:hypothetical protein
VGIQRLSGSDLGNARAVWLAGDFADQHADCLSRPSGGLIPPTYRIDPRAVHHALTVSEPRTADSVLWRRDRQSVWLSPVISVAPRQKSSDTDRHPGDAGGLALCQIADLLAFASLWHPRAAANHNDQRRVYWAEAGATCQSSWP